MDTSNKFRVAMKSQNLNAFVHFENDEYTLSQDQAEATLFTGAEAKATIEAMRVKAQNTGYRPARGDEVLVAQMPAGTIEFQIQELDGSNFMQTFYVPKVEPDDVTGSEVVTRYVRTQ